MKKFLAICIIALALGVAPVFADHPSGLAVGVVGQGGLGGIGPGFSLKTPGIPIYWAINLSLTEFNFGIGATGDYYIYDDILVAEAGLGWYLGGGGFVGFNSHNERGDNYDYTELNFGVRVPVGLSWMIPVETSAKLELFLELFPALGMRFRFWDSKYDNDHDGSKIGLHFNVGGGIGLRFWL
jgi:hypothetical protein